MSDTEPCPPPRMPEREITEQNHTAASYGLWAPGGLVAIPKPTRADLLLSCRQWSDAVRDAIVDCEEDGRVLAKLERLNAVLAELKEMG